MPLSRDRAPRRRSPLPARHPRRAQLASRCLLQLQKGKPDVTLPRTSRNYELNLSLELLSSAQATAGDSDAEGDADGDADGADGADGAEGADGADGGDADDDDPSESALVAEPKVRRLSAREGGRQGASPRSRRRDR